MRGKICLHICIAPAFPVSLSCARGEVVSLGPPHKGSAKKHPLLCVFRLSMNIFPAVVAVIRLSMNIFFIQKTTSAYLFIYLLAGYMRNPQLSHQSKLQRALGAGQGALGA